MEERTAGERPAVLVIDDDADFRELVRLYLEAIDVDVYEAGDCPEGLAVLERIRDRVTVVLVDYWMPHMSPPTCASRIRKLARPSTRVLLVTAAVDAQARAAEVGIDEYLSKPFDLDRLVGIVAAATGISVSEGGSDEGPAYRPPR